MEKHQAPMTADMTADEEARMIAALGQVFDLARHGDAAALAALIARGMPPNLRNEKGDSLVMLAAYHGQADTLRTLLEAGASPDIRNAMGQTPIAGAAYKGFKEIVEILLAHGADVEGASPDGRTALMTAADAAAFMAGRHGGH